MSATTIITEVVAILGVLGVGSILGQYVGSSKDRREARAGVLSALAEVESGRWVGANSKTPDEFRSSLRSLQTAALIARLPRDAVWEYAVLGQAARWLSDEQWEREPDPELGGHINGYLAEAVREAARAIVVMAWAPTLMHRRQWHLAKKRIDESLARVQTEATKDEVKRSRAQGFM